MWDANRQIIIYPFLSFMFMQAKQHTIVFVYISMLPWVDRLDFNSKKCWNGFPSPNKLLEIRKQKARINANPWTLVSKYHKFKISLINKQLVTLDIQQNYGNKLWCTDTSSQRVVRCPTQHASDMPPKRVGHAKNVSD